MKRYGFNKATEFSKKQIGVIYYKAKSGELKIEKWVMNDLYDLADYYGYDDNGNVEYAERKVLKILECIFGGDFEQAQSLLDAYADSTYESFGNKTKAKCDRTVFVA